MNVIKNLRIGTRLGAGFGVVILAALFIAVFGRMALGGAQADVVALSGALDKVDVVRDINDDINLIARGLRNMILLTDSTRIAEEKSRIVEARKRVGENMQKLDVAITSEKGRALLKTLTERRAVYITVTERLMTQIEASKKAEAIDLLMGEVRESQAQYLGALGVSSSISRRWQPTSGPKSPAKSPPPAS